MKSCTARASQLPQGRRRCCGFRCFQDNTGARQPPLETLRLLLRRASVPVFSHHDVNLGLGVVGGYVISAQAVGDLIARLALGLPLPADPALLNASLKTYMFDDSVLQRWDIDPALLPPGSVLINPRGAPPWLAQGWRSLAVAGGRGGAGAADCGPGAEPAPAHRRPERAGR